MKRRSFIKAVPVLASFAYLPAFASQESDKRHLIAIGIAASILSLKHDINIGFDTVTIVTESKPKFASDEIEFIEFNPPDSAYTFLGEHKYLKKEPFQVIDLPMALRKAIRAKNGKVVMLAALGKYTGTVLSKSISDEFDGANNLRFINTIPFSFEGSFIQNQSKLVAAEISLKHQCQTLHLEDIREKYGNLAIRSAFKKTDEELKRMIIS